MRPTRARRRNDAQLASAREAVLLPLMNGEVAALPVLFTNLRKSPPKSRADADVGPPVPQGADLTEWVRAFAQLVQDDGTRRATMLPGPAVAPHAGTGPG